MQPLRAADNVTAAPWRADKLERGCGGVRIQTEPATETAQRLPW